MTWSYRLMRLQEDDDVIYAIHEVYYGDAGKVTGWTQSPANVVADDRAGVLRVLAMMAEAYQQPVLDAHTGAEVEPELVASDQMVASMAAIMDATSDATTARGEDGANG